MEDGAHNHPQPHDGTARTEQRTLAAVNWVARHVILLLAVALAVKWMPSPWNAIAGVAVLFILGVTRSYQRRIARRVRAIPRVRAAVAYLVVSPPEKD